MFLIPVLLVKCDQVSYIFTLINVVLNFFFFKKYELCSCVNIKNIKETKFTFFFLFKKTLYETS